MAENPALTPDDVTPMTCARDGLDHAVSTAAFAEGRRAGLGIYRAACGGMVEVTSMTCPPGPLCPLCVRALNPRVVAIPDQRGSRQGGLVGLIRRLHHGSAA